MPTISNNETSYFASHYGDVRFPLAAEGSAGLQRAQLGAICSITSHFTIRKEPAIVVMPTGSGKTGVLMMAPFTLQARRVLVLTPSRLVRNQISTNFESLGLLIRLGVLPQGTPPPKVCEIDEKPQEPDDWERLKAFDVVVGIPNTISPATAGNATPPADLFDLILVDEAHHSPARVWAGIFNAFPGAKKALFTATPSRRDQKEIRGHFVYVYPLREAFNDKIFGRIEFRPVAESSGTANDILIARKAQEIFTADRNAGKKHALMVRTDSIDRSKELAAIYARETTLNLETVHSGFTAKRVDATIKKLRDGAIDGIICVAMLGEGFDFPNLKIAAIHAPHKSLEVTLQFIGRFARTGGEDIGIAKFIAVPSEIEIESQKLYDEDALWQEIVENLSETKIRQEQRVREALITRK